MAALSSPPTAEQQQQAMETSRALESLSTSLRQLREHHNASLVPFEEPAARVFARLALSSTINWANVSDALRTHYTLSSSPSSVLLANGVVQLRQRPLLAGDFGVELVVRVLKRFERFQLISDAHECMVWAKKLEDMVWDEIVDLGGMRLVQPDNEARQQPHHAPTVDRNQFHYGATPSIASQGYPTPHRGLAPSIYAQAGSSSIDRGDYDSPATSQYDSGSAKRGRSPSDASTTGERQVRFEGAGSTPSKRKGSGDKEAFGPGMVVFAKFVHPRDKERFFPGIIFDSEKAPEQVEGKRIDSSFLVAPISGISEWYWLAPSRLKRLPIAKAAKSYQETNLTYQQKLEEANKQTEYINKLAASPYRTEQGVKLRDMNLELTFLYGLLEGLKVVADENETSTWEEKKLKELQGGQEGGGEEGPQIICTCRQLDGQTEGTLIGCESPTCPIGWFHPSCVGIEDDPTKVEDYWCEACIDLKPQMES